MLKRADVATYTITMEVANGVPKDGNNVFGLDRGGVGFSTSGGFVDPIKAQLDAFADPSIAIPAGVISRTSGAAARMVDRPIGQISQTTPSTIASARR